MNKQHILFDENLSTSRKTLAGQLYELLLSENWECHSVHEYPDLIGHTDEEIIAYAKQQGWALLTLDKRMAYLSVKEGVSTYLILQEKRSDEEEEIEGYTVVHLEPFATVEARKSYDVRMAEKK